MRGPNGYKVVAQGLQQMKVSVALYTRCALLHLLLTSIIIISINYHMVAVSLICLVATSKKGASHPSEEG